MEVSRQKSSYAAILLIYSSEQYKSLSREQGDTKLWHLGAVALYEMMQAG